MKKEIDLKNASLEELAYFIAEALEKKGIDATLVGGACVSIYSNNLYQSYDLDFVTYHTIREIEAVLKILGFQKKGRSFAHPLTPYLIDFVSAPIAVGNEVVRKVETRESLKLLTPTDCVKDRLSAYYHWNDQQAFDQALAVARKQPINLDDIRRWSEKEGQIAKFQKFLHAL